MLELFQRVALATDVPEDGLKRGDVGTLTDFAPHPTGGERGCIVEFFNAIGESIAVIVVPESSVEPLRADEIWSVRELVTVV
ncbi:MAG: DUF4926 domain-containing protein [Chthonomonadales bacterium]